MKKVTKKPVKKATEKKPKVVKTEEPYTVTVKIMGHTHQSQGQTIKEALEGLEIRNAKGRCIMTVQKGDKSKERVLMPVLAFRLFNSAGMTKEVTIKNVSLLFGI